MKFLFYVFLFLLMIFLVCGGVGLRIDRPLLGLVLGLLCDAALIGLFLLYGYLMYEVWQPEFPLCESKKCKKKMDYYYIGAKDSYAFYRCNCGHKYAATMNPESGDTFLMKILPDGRKQPYRKHTFWGRWKPDPKNVKNDGNR